ncbi:glycosyltransferase family 4 protein [Pectobacterium sp. S5]|uniref:glycosyltransferase family 4 protein n=1 Tax=Pectobacterium TaxID=122277 RepID=UPI003D9BA356
MKRICFFIASVKFSGGTERMTNIIANSLVDKKYNVNVLSVFEGKEAFFPFSNEVKLYSLYESEVVITRKYIPTIARLRAFVKKNKIDSLIDVDSILSLVSVPALCGLDVKHITWEHFNYKANIENTKRIMSRKLAAFFSDTVVTLTERDRNLWIENCRCRAEIVTINNPIVPFSLEDDVVHSSYPVNVKTVLSIGRLTYQKGFDLLICAWELIKKNDSNDEWKLKIVGDGEDRVKLMDLIEQKKLADSVRILPTTKNVSTLYKNADIYCMSSRYEGLPMVLLEASFYRLPIVSFDCDTGPAEIISHNETGFLCENGNINDLAKYLNFLMNNEEQRVCFSRNSEKNIQKFLIESLLDKWIEII